MTYRMLKTFLYLNEQALADYVSGLEGGMRGPLSRKSILRGSVDGGLDVKVLKGGGSRGREDEESVTITDTPQALFNRFLELVAQDPEEVGWLEVMDVDSDLNSANVGMTINVEAEIFVPDAVNALSRAGDLGDMVDALEALLPFVETFGLDTRGLPPPEQRKAAKGFASLQNLTGGKTVVVGELLDSDWRVAGQLSLEHLRGDLDGLATVVGKVSSKWSKGKWKPVLALPGTSLIPREQRRQMERQGPDSGQEANFIEGPALMLDVLAIYR